MKFNIDATGGDIYVNFYENMEAALKFRDSLKDYGIFCIIDPDSGDWTVKVTAKDLENKAKDLIEVLEGLGDI